MDDDAVTFVGGLDMNPNADGLGFFLESAWPVIRERAPAARLHDRKGLGRPGPAPGGSRARDVRGPRAHIRPHLARAAAVIVPLRLGGGTRLKILHAWGMAKAIVSTSVGSEGLRAVDGENILVRDDPVRFAEAVLELLGNRDLRRRLGEAGRETVAELYDWNVIGALAREAYSSLPRHPA